MSWTREILAGLENDAARQLREPKKRRARSPARLAADSPEVDSLSCVDFGARLVSLAELAKISGIGQKLLRGMVRSGELRPVKIPGAQRLRYSPQMLAQVIKRQNQSFY